MSAIRSQRRVRVWIVREGFLEEVTAKLVKSIRPAFNAEYTILNGTFRYALLPEKTNLVRIDFKGGVPIVTPEEGDSESPGEI